MKSGRGFNGEASSTQGKIKSRKKVSCSEGWVGPFTALLKPTGPPCVLAEVDFNQLQEILNGMPAFLQPHVDLLYFGFVLSLDK